MDLLEKDPPLEKGQDKLRCHKPASRKASEPRKDVPPQENIKPHLPKRISIVVFERVSC